MSFIDIKKFLIQKSSIKPYVSVIFQYFRYAFFLISVSLFEIGYLVYDYNLILCGVLFLFFSNVCFSFCDIKNNIIFLFFHITVFTFILSRPTISMLRGDLWWYFEPSAVFFALNALFLSLLCMRIGAIIGDEILKRNLIWKNTSLILDEQCSQIDFRYSLQVISLIFFLITISFDILLEMEKLLFMQGREYTEYYTSFRSVFPSPVRTLASMSKYALCLFLATLPEKRITIVPLFIYFLSKIPSLLIGVRNPIVLSVIFIFLYYIFRDVFYDKQLWFGKFEKIFVVIFAPIALIFLSAWNYIRNGTEAVAGVWASIVDLFYKQGTSFDVLCMGYQSIPNLPDIISKNYTFGPFLDYFMHGTVAQKFFGAMSLGSQNSEVVAIYGNSFAHSMSYVAHPQYLNGQGWGSSYLLESFADWGYIGIIWVSLIFGLLFVLMMLALRKNILLRTMVLVGLLSLFFVPRAEATGWLLFLVTIQFWLTIIFCYILAGLCTRKYSFNCKKFLRSDEKEKF